PAPPLRAPLSLHDALPILPGVALRPASDAACDALHAAWDDDLIVFISPAAVRYAARWIPLHGRARAACVGAGTARALARHGVTRSEEHTSELQSRFDLVCR